MTAIDWTLVHEFFLSVLREDVGSGDITSRAAIPADAQAVARYAAKQPLIAAGVEAIGIMARVADPRLEYECRVSEGDAAATGTILAEVRGSAHSILAVERSTLNLLQRMCGIATYTRRFVDRVAGTRARIVDTRKTAPGMRVFDKHAVACGGGMNHRVGLFDGVLIKNNHLAFHPSIGEAVRSVRIRLGHLTKIEVEVPRASAVEEAVAAGADIVLLDNLTPEETRKAVEIAAGRVPLESSGGMTLETVRAFAEAGVDYISIGALTHSAPAADIHLRVTPGRLS